MKLGKRPARPDAIKLKFGSYFKTSLLPTPPLKIGCPWLVSAWGLFANDRLADCVWAGAAHETMLWNAEAEQAVSFADISVIADYVTASGYNPQDPTTDQGADMQEAASYRKKTGVVDASGKRHTIDAYVEIAVGDLDQLTLATYLMGAVGLGLQLPDNAQDQFDEAQPWSFDATAKIEGGHYVSCIGRNSRGDFLVVTWGRLQAVTPEFVRNYMDEGICFLSFERLRNSLSRQGFDKATLQDDLKQIGAQHG